MGCLVDKKIYDNGRKLRVVYCLLLFPFIFIKTWWNNYGFESVSFLNERKEKRSSDSFFIFFLLMFFDVLFS